MDRVSRAGLGGDGADSLGQAWCPVMRVVMTTAAPSADAMTEPPPHPGPAHGEHEHDDRERDHGAGDVNDVAEGVVARGIRRLRQLNDRYLHHGSSVTRDEAAFRSGCRQCGQIVACRPADEHMAYSAW